MTSPLENTVTILERLVSFDSVSGRPTQDIVGYIKDYLASYGVESTLSFDDSGERANVFATIGPDLDGGVVLSGHTDVVPVEGQSWNEMVPSYTEFARHQNGMLDRGPYLWNRVRTPRGDETQGYLVKRNNSTERILLQNIPHCWNVVGQAA